MKIKHENGLVTFVMRTGKCKVRSKMTLAEAQRIISSGKNIETKNNEIIVDDNYFFPAEPEKKSRKKTKGDEVSENE